MGRIWPSKNFDVYKTIFIGEVTGIQLTEHQDLMLEGLKSEEDFIYLIDTTVEHEVTLLPLRLKKGVASEVEKLKISGCGIPEPIVRQLGIFFVKPNGDVNVIYNVENSDYEDYIKKIDAFYGNVRKKLKVNRY